MPPLNQPLDQPHSLLTSTYTSFLVAGLQKTDFLIKHSLYIFPPHLADRIDQLTDNEILSILQSDNKRDCSTKPCLDLVSVLKRNLDTSTKPCDDMYQYACGGMLKRYSSLTESTFGNMHKQEMVKLKNVLDELKDRKGKHFILVFPTSSFNTDLFSYQYRETRCFFQNTQLVLGVHEHETDKQTRHQANARATRLTGHVASP